MRSSVGLLSVVFAIVFLSGCTAYVAENETTENITENETRDEYTQAQENKPVTEQVSDFRNSPDAPSEYELSQLSECSTPVYSIYPVDMSKVREITPLGSLAPPGHTFPTEHAFIHFTTGGETIETQPLYAPSDIRVLLIAFSHGITQDPVDYTIYFSSCRDVIGYYNHVKEISPNMQKLVDESECMFQGESKTTRCNIRAFESVSAGELIGYVGRLQGNWDFGTFDLSKNLGFANPSRYGTRSPHIQCAFEYYDAEMRETFFNLIERNDENQCSVVMQDVPGTLKGNWFFGDARADMGDAWDKYLAFVNDNNNPSTQVISIGGVFTDAGKIEFTPKSSGNVNREFSQVTSDGGIYCYDGSSGRVVVQMTSDAELKIEKQSGSCTGSYAFSNPTVYGR